MAIDLVRLGFVADTTDLKSAEPVIDRTRRKTKDLGDAADDTADRWDGMASRLKSAAVRAAGAVGIALSLGAVQNAADTWSDLQSRVGNAVGSMDEAPAVLKRISEMARMSYSDLQLTAEGFIANRQALADLGLSTQQQLDYTEALNNAMVISGAKGEHAARVQDALAKAMAIGKLSGDDLNAVIFRGDRVAAGLAKTLGTTVSGLRKMGTEGKITSDVIVKTLIGSMAELRAEAEEMPATIGDAFTLIGNSFLELVGTVDQATGVSGALASVLIMLADNLDRIAVYAATGAAVIGGAWVAGMVAAKFATLGWAGAMAVARTALLRLGVGAIIVAVGELIYRFVELADSVGGFGNLFGVLGDAGKAAMDWIKASAFALLDAFRGITLTIATYFTATWARVQAGFARLMAAIQGGVNSMVTNINSAFTFDIKNPFTGEIMTSMKGLGLETTNFADGYIKAAEDSAAAAETLGEKATEAFGKMRDRFKDLKSPMDVYRQGMAAAAEEASTAAKKTDELGSSLNNLTTPSGGGKGKGGGGKDKKGEENKAAKAIAELRKELEMLSATYQMTELAANIWKAQQEAGVSATSAQGAEIDALMTKIDALKTKQEQLATARQNAENALKTTASNMTTVFQAALKGSDALKDALGNLAGQLGTILMNRAFMALLGGGGAGGGGWLAGLLKGIASFEGGGYTGAGSRTGGLDGRGGRLAVIHPNETVYDHTKNSGASAGSGAAAFEATLGVKVDPESGTIAPYVKNMIRKSQYQSDRQLSDKVKQVIRDVKAR